jgi:hypothetical protein
MPGNTRERTGSVADRDGYEGSGARGSAAGSCGLILMQEPQERGRATSSVPSG